MPEVPDIADLQKALGPAPARPSAAPSSPAPSPPAGGVPDIGELWKQLGGSPTTAPAKPPTDWGHALWEGIKYGAREIAEGGAQIGARMQATAPEAAFIPEAAPMTAAAPDDAAARQALPGRVDEAVRRSAQAYAQDPAVRAHPLVAGGGRIGGNIAAGTALTAGIPGIGLGGGAARAGIGVLGRGALGGGIGGAMQPVVPQQPRPMPGAAQPSVPQTPQRQPYGTPSSQISAPSPAIPAQDYWTEKMWQVGLGTGIGAIIPGIGSALSPRLPSAQAVARFSSGIARAFRPLYNFFTGAEERTDEGFARTIARQVLDPIGGNIDRRLSGWDLNRAVEKQISDAYDRVLPNVTVTPQGLLTPSTGVTNALATLNADEAKTYQNLLNAALPKDLATRNTPLTGQEFREARTMIARQGYKWIGTNKEDIGEALIEYAKHMTDVIAAQNPAYAAPLKAAGEAYKMWMRMAAAASQPTKGGKFSPTDMLRASRSQEPSATGFATGESILQGYAQAAYRAMGSRSMSLLDLMHVFAHRGLPMQVYEQVIGPVARAAKAATPAISPGLGAVAGSLEQEPRRRAVERRIPDTPYVGPSGM